MRLLATIAAVGMLGVAFVAGAVVRHLVQPPPLRPVELAAPPAVVRLVDLQLSQPMVDKATSGKRQRWTCRPVEATP